jgi:BASS family bile acid:Na+ symporter
MYVLVPLAAVALVRILHPVRPVGGAMLVLAVSAGAPILAKKLLKLDRESYVLGLSVTTSLLAIVTVPAWISFLAPLFGSDASVEPVAIASVLAKGFLAPLVVGMLLHPVLGKRADAVSMVVLKVAGLVLGIAGLILIVASFGLIASIGWGSLLALAALAVVATAIGHLVGGPDPGERTALAVACGSRHVGIAMLAASATPQKATIALVLAYLLVAALVTIPYLKWRGAS